MRQRGLWVVAMLAAAAVVSVGLTVFGADEEQVSLEQLPPAVRATIEKHAAGATLKEIEKETRNGVVTYEAEWEVDGVEHSVSCAASGEVTALEQGAPIGSLPPAVLSAVNAKFPGATLKEVDRVQVFFYAVEGVKDGKPFEVKVLATGRICGHDNGDDEEDDDGKEKE